MELNQESVAAYKTLMTQPKENGMDFDPIEQLFTKSETVTAFHILYNQYIDRIKKPLPKVFFYIIFEEIYGPVTGKDSDGHAGYHMTIVPEK